MYPPALQDNELSHSGKINMHNLGTLRCASHEEYPWILKEKILQKKSDSIHDSDLIQPPCVSSQGGAKNLLGLEKIIETFIATDCLPKPHSFSGSA
jgi:hypothetical protein